LAARRVRRVRKRVPLHARAVSHRVLAVARPAVGLAIREAREARGVSQAKLARRVRLPRSSILRMEAGELPVGLLELADIADALEMDPVELLRACMAKRP
jgi:HTH-type transcriptional regulator / antitoxin HipB